MEGAASADPVRLRAGPQGCLRAARPGRQAAGRASAVQSRPPKFVAPTAGSARTPPARSWLRPLPRRAARPARARRRPSSRPPARPPRRSAPTARCAGRPHRRPAAGRAAGQSDFGPGSAAGGGRQGGGTGAERLVERPPSGAHAPACAAAAWQHGAPPAQHTPHVHARHGRRRCSRQQDKGRPQGRSSEPAGHRNGQRTAMGSKMSWMGGRPSGPGGTPGGGAGGHTCAARQRARACSGVRSGAAARRAAAAGGAPGGERRGRGAQAGLVQARGLPTWRA